MRIRLSIDWLTQKICLENSFACFVDFITKNSNVMVLLFDISIKLFLFLSFHHSILLIFAMYLVWFLVVKRKSNFELKKLIYLFWCSLHSTFYYSQHTGTVMQFVNIIQFSSRASTKIECEHKKRMAQMPNTNREKVEKIMIITFLDLCIQLIRNSKP